MVIGECDHGLRPTDEPTPDKVGVVLRIWSGDRPIKFGFSHHGTWAVVFCDVSDKLRLPVPAIDPPADDYLPPPTSLPVEFVKAVPEAFIEVGDPRNANWELFVARRLAVTY